MFCKNCGQPMSDNQEICLNCGVKKGVGIAFCANCGAPVPNPLQEICLNCGVSLKNGSNGAYLNGQDKVTMALICFFLGGFGVHNFMMGETKKGIFKIIFTFVFCGVGGIFALIDFVKILTDKYVVDPDKLF